MDFKLVSADEGLDIMPFVSGLKWSDSIDTLGLEMSFTLPDNFNDKNFNFLDNITLGNGLSLFKGNEIITQVIIVEEDNGNNTRSFKAYDYAFWLNKSTTIKQFNKISSENAIKELCAEFGINVEISGLTSVITKIYNDKTVSEIIKDIININTAENKKKYVFEMEKSTVKISPYEKIIIDSTYELSKNNLVKATDFLNNVSYNRSITDLKNKIIVISGDEKTQRIVAEAKDDASIKEFGLLQEVEKFDEKSKGNAQNIANNKLKRLNRINEEISLTILGNEKIRSGRIVELENDNLYLHGEYLIKDCEHSLENNNHKCSINLIQYSESDIENEIEEATEAYDKEKSKEQAKAEKAAKKNSKKSKKGKKNKKDKDKKSEDKNNKKGAKK